MLCWRKVIPFGDYVHFGKDQQRLTFKQDRHEKRGTRTYYITAQIWFATAHLNAPQTGVLAKFT
jgi:hypothetical protein